MGQGVRGVTADDSDDDDSNDNYLDIILPKNGSARSPDSKF